MSLVLLVQLVVNFVLVFVESRFLGSSSAN